MKMQRLIMLLIGLLAATVFQTAAARGAVRQTKNKGGLSFIFRITLTDKQGSPYSLDHPTRFLSRRAVERRKRQGLAIDSTDLPVNPHYVRLLNKKDAHVIGQSRWQNTVLIWVKDTMQMQPIDQLPFVKSRHLVWQSPDSVTVDTRNKAQDHFDEYDKVATESYGKSSEQIRSLMGDRLHENDYCGQGMMIAVIDGGFKNADRIPAIQQMDIRGWHDFVSPDNPRLFSETDHGTKVLSTMGVNVPYYYIGTAPKASYWLLRSEDQQSEQEVEEDYWAMAAEFADSVGCDLINSSLGYNEYDHIWMSHRLWELDGKATFVSRSAAMLADKGIVLVNSAGNSGMGSWKKITIPGDADNVLTIGAVSPEEPHRIAPFSSIGPTQDGRIKPELVAIGAPCYLVNGRGVIIQDMGTSFAAPIVCGLMACLWQALPQLTAKEIIKLICQTGNNVEHPDNVYGYGMPDFWKALLKGKGEN